MPRLHPKMLLLLPLFGTAMALELGRMLARRPWGGFTLAASNAAGALDLLLWAGACVFILLGRTLGHTLSVAGVAAVLMQGLLVVSAGNKLGLLHLAAGLFAVLALKRGTTETMRLARSRHGAYDDRRGAAGTMEAGAW